MMQHLGIFYQHMPPHPSAAALRGGSVVSALEHQLRGRGIPLQVVTTAGAVADAPGTVALHVLSDADVDNGARLLRRLVGELHVGWRAGHRLVRGRPAAVLISSPAFLAALVISWVCRLRRVPYVLEVRDVYPQVYAQAGLLREASLPYRILMRLSVGLYRHARLIVTATGGLRDAVAPKAPGIPTECVYNGYPARLRELRPAKRERFTVCFHGVLGFFQDVETLRAVAVALQPHEVDVIVIGYGRKEAVLTQQPPANLTFLGRQSFDRTIEEVARCHVGLCLRPADDISRDAFPVKVWEYLGLGLPSLVTPACEGGAFVESHGCGKQLRAGDVDGLVAEILRLRDRPEELAAMQAACDMAAGRYTREKLGARVAELVDRALRTR